MPACVPVCLCACVSVCLCVCVSVCLCACVPASPRIRVRYRQLHGSSLWCHLSALICFLWHVIDVTPGYGNWERVATGKAATFANPSSSLPTCATVVLMIWTASQWDTITFFSRLGDASIPPNLPDLPLLLPQPIKARQLHHSPYHPTAHVCS